MLVIGAGAGGLVTAAGSVGLGAKVAIIERNFMGGDCLVSGCVPSKALIAAANVAHTIATASDFGIAIKGGAIEI
jgi:pyruvate/2-oxoglutarate dehydrogenase complex dihydrolipoamide dehydrogenase (E3) component